MVIYIIFLWKPFTGSPPEAIARHFYTGDRIYQRMRHYANKGHGYVKRDDTKCKPSLSNKYGESLHYSTDSNIKLNYDGPADYEKSRPRTVRRIPMPGNSRHLRRNRRWREQGNSHIKDFANGKIPSTQFLRGRTLVHIHLYDLYHFPATAAFPAARLTGRTLRATGIVTHTDPGKPPMTIIVMDGNTAVHRHAERDKYGANKPFHPMVISI